MFVSTAFGQEQSSIVTMATKMLPFLCIPRVPNCMENLKGSWKFSFPKLFDSYKDSFLTAIVCNFRTFVGLFIFVIRYGSNHEMDIKRFQLFLLAKKTGKCTWYTHTFPPIWRIEGYLLNSTQVSESRDIRETIFPSPYLFILKKHGKCLVLTICDPDVLRSL